MKKANVVSTHVTDVTSLIRNTVIILWKRHSYHKVIFTKKDETYMHVSLHLLPGGTRKYCAARSAGVMGDYSRDVNYSSPD